MSSRPGAGDENARDDGPELQGEAEIEEQEGDISSDSPSSVRLRTDNEDATPEPGEENTSHENVKTGNLQSLQEPRTRRASLQLRRGPPSEEETSSVPDDSPSVQGSNLSSVQSDEQSLQSRPSSTTPRRPFDQRFQSRLAPSSLGLPIAYSPGFLSTHSRQSSLASAGLNGLPDSDSSLAAWDTIRWAKLRKLTGQAFSEAGKRNFGRPTCLVVSTCIVIGTSKGIVLVFDYQQNAKSIIGSGTKAVECGPIASLAISEDSTSIAVGHTGGHIFTWELLKPTRPFLHIPPIDGSPVESQRSNGHLSGVSIIHVGFLGFRHTALVSADDRGMAFCHLATRGMSSIVRAIRTARILGRYPDVSQRVQKARKPSSVLAFSPLPLGNVEQTTNTLGLVAMMTPYLLVIVSTTPLAQTQHKAARPKEIAAHSAMSASLAWFPAIKLKAQEDPVSKTKLVYCWSNILTVLEVSEVEPLEHNEKEMPLELAFKARSRWRAHEPIVAVQWLSRSVMAILTITQQLIILEDVSMNPTDSSDLVQKQIYHSDLFSQQLQSLVELIDEEDSSMHGVVADAFYMSFRAYKGRLFVLGVNEISIGSLSNWADRLLATLEAGDFIGAIRLATSYYFGDCEKVTIGLPEHDGSRHAIVQEKLLEIMSASLKYAFGQNQQAGTGQLGKLQLRDLAVACVDATRGMDDDSFLYDQVFAWYDDHDRANIFLDILEPYIIDGQIKFIPPVALKALIDHYMTTHTPARLEEVICRLDTSTMDIDQMTSLCKGYNLFDAFIYVWTGALGDYISPIEELLKPFRLSSQANGPRTVDADQAQRNAFKIFPYLSFTLTSRIYPTGNEAATEEARKAKEQIYEFFFSGALGHASGKSSSPELVPSFPHLRELLSIDTASSMGVFNEAFEDDFLNRPDEVGSGFDKGAIENGAPESKSYTRQYIIAVLLEIMTSTPSRVKESIFIDMFVARSLPKYPQDLVLSGSTLNQILGRLCRFFHQDVAEDCELSVEYLLSVYHPPNIQAFVPLFREASFFRVLKSVYRSGNQWPLLVRTYFQDTRDQGEVFGVIRTCLRDDTFLSDKQQREIQDIISTHPLDLTNIDVGDTAQLVADVLPDAHESFLSALEGDSYLQYAYLKSLFESPGRASVHAQSPHSLIGRYIQLMCQHNPLHVVGFVESLRDVDLQIRDLMPSFEASGVIDAAVILMAREGRAQDAMGRLIKHLSSLEAALSAVLQSENKSPDMANTDVTIHDLLDSIKKYADVGIWLCQRQMKAAQRLRPVSRLSRKSKSAFQILSPEENLWLQLIISVVGIAKKSYLPKLSKQAQAAVDTNEGIGTAPSLRTVVQNVFTALLQATTAAREASGDRDDLSFLHILRAFLTQAAASSPSLAELRAVISSVFSAYAYEESLLALSNSMLDKELFVHVDEIAKLRRRGWRPRGQVCEMCRRRVWGPGAGVQIWDAWSREVEPKHHQRVDREYIAAPEISASNVKGKETTTVSTLAESAESAENGTSWTETGFGPAFVFACRHLFHEACLDRQTGKAPGRRVISKTSLEAHEKVERVCPICASSAGT